ncbi:sugar phosphate nucleotidyltransferase [Promethearchaeum syntrophicum]|uniref:Sugar phosphate nucleotidyltransferase n=1 Tax=Promethearchaeum syntrophicum TaxID=2594042 RepID=A0A5B9D7W9_9ARCH|nr:NDP-sugar synthase [Candidatus Prometheoarchaeum syntrophicum]QEE15328.1 Bifunctional protein GlmU [Candidatus Prometheoarchaeum syntrophicum]
MKLILPIAGVGLRLRPFTSTKPKGFVQIAGSRGVDHILKKIGSSLPDKTPIALITGYKKQQIQQYVEENYSNQFNPSFIEQIPRGYNGDIPYFSGLGHAILLSKEWYERTADIEGRLNPNDSLIFLSDMIPVNNYDFILKDLEKEDNDGIIGSMTVPDEKTRFYGIIETNKDGYIYSLVEKPEKTKSNQAIAGVYAFKAKAMKRLYEILDEQYKKHLDIIDTLEKKEFQLTPALQQLVEEGFKLKSASFKKGILDFGRPEALLNSNRILLDAMDSDYQKHKVEIIDSVIINPSAIETGTKIVHSVVGPYSSIGKNCVIEDCNLNNVVIGDNCVLKKIITRKSIVGDFVQIESIIKNHMTIGDNTTLYSDF